MTELQALGIHPKGRGETRADCPHCLADGKQNTLGVNTESGVYHCFRCGCSGKAGDGSSLNGPTVRALSTKAKQRGGDKVIDIWRRALPLSGSPAEAHLLSRNCRLPPADGDLRFLPATDRYPPSMVGLVTDAVTGEPMTLHFTNLPKRDKSRFLSGYQKTGGVIRLWPDDWITTGLGLAEGVETALSMAHGYTPVWATMDSGNLENFPVLGGIESLVLAEDGDKAGREACRACAERWMAAGVEVHIVRSPDGEDLNDG
jgi:hypothetical protein